MAKRLIEKTTRLTVDNSFQGAAFAKRDNRDAGRLRLNGNYAEIFDSRKKQRLCIRIHTAQFIIRDATEENNIAASCCATGKGITHFAVADDHELAPHFKTGVNGEIGAFIIAKFACVKVIRLRLKRK